MPRSGREPSLRPRRPGHGSLWCSPVDAKPAAQWEHPHQPRRFPSSTIPPGTATTELPEAPRRSVGRSACAAPGQARSRMMSGTASLGPDRHANPVGLCKCRRRDGSVASARWAGGAAFRPRPRACQCHCGRAVPDCTRPRRPPTGGTSRLATARWPARRTVCRGPTCRTCVTVHGR
jgi:hypothetical protein